MTNALYVRIYEALRDDISTGRLRPGDQIPTEQELSETYEVSRITAIRAVKELENRGLIYRMKGKGSFVRAESEWRENRERSGFISFVVPFGRQADSGHALLNGAEAQAKKAGHFLTVHNSEESWETEKGIILDLLEHRTEGLLLYPNNCYENFEILSRLIIERIPLVVVDRPVVGIAASFVGPDNIGGIAAVVDHLAKLGHRRIAFLANTRRNLLTEQERFAGYCRAMATLGIPLRREYVRIEDELPPTERVAQWHDMDANVAAAKGALERLMSLPEPPTAMVTVNDLYAVVLEKAARRMGIAIPAELSITGFDDLPMVAHIEVPLTTVAQPFARIGETAIQVMENLMRDPASPAQTHLLPTEIVVRESTGAPSVRSPG